MFTLPVFKCQNGCLEKAHPETTTNATNFVSIHQPEGERI